MNNNEPSSTTPLTALITGASGGIGLELARVFARERYNLILTARRQPQLDELADELRGFGVSVQVFLCDLTDRTAVRSLFRAVQETGAPVDVLVNNAGFGDHGEFAVANLDRMMAMIELNVASLTLMSRLFLPGMLERRRGRIMNVCSVASFQPGPLMAVYYATKAFVLSLSEALAEELRGTGVTVTALCPGPTRSGFQEEAGLNRVPPYEYGRLPGSSEVAEFGYRAMVRGKRIAVHGVLFRVAVFVQRFLPRATVVSMVRKLQEKRGTE